MRFTVLFFFLLFTLSATLSGQQDSSEESYSCILPSKESAIQSGMTNAQEIQFWRSLNNQSTATSFVLISVRDVSSAKETLYCTMSNYLQGAVHMEFGISYDEKGIAKVHSYILARRNGYFVFSKRKALKNIKKLYTDKELEWSRQSIANASDEELIQKFNSSYTYESSLFQAHSYKDHRSFMFSMGHALYERGLSVGIGCVSSKIWVCQ